MDEKIFVFLDESGDWNFNRKGSEYLVFACLTLRSPFFVSNELEQLKYGLISEGHNVSHFHASEDKQYIRNQVYGIIKKPELDYEVDVVYFEKNKANPSLYADYSEPKLYLKVYDVLLKYVFNRHVIKNIIILTDAFPHKKWRESIEKGLKISIRSHLAKETKFTILHHASKTNFCLQAVDYFSWAIYRKLGNWGDKEDRPYNEIRGKIVSVFDLFKYSDGKAYY